MKSDRIKGVYLIADPDHCAPLPIESVVSEALDGGVTVVQLRVKDRSRDEVVELGTRIKRLCDITGALFIVNDYPDVACEVEADGVHIGQGDMNTFTARQLLSDGQLLGRSCSSLEQALQADREGVDYIAAGALFSTSTKRDTTAVTLEQLREIRKRVARPLVAIGGINSDNATRVLDSGVDAICVGSAITKSVSPKSVSVTLMNLCTR